MNQRNSEKGQALVIIALAAVGLVAFTALAIDGSRVFSDRRHAQNAADTAVLAAALAKIRTPDYPPNSPGDSDLAAKAAGLDRAASNGYTNDADSIVEVHICNEVGLNPPCEGIPAGADPSEYIQVKIVSTIPTTFARIIGRATVTSTLTAIARAKPGSDAPLFAGTALVALSPNDPSAFSGQGNVFLDVNNSGVFVNSNATGCPSNGAMNAGGNVNYTVDTAYDLVGGYCTNGNVSINGQIQAAAPVAYPPALSIPSPSITCTGPSTLSGSTYSPGIHPARTIWDPNITFAPGNHCFTGDINFTGNTTITANDVNFVMTAGAFRLNNNSTFTCNNMLAYFTGTSGGMHFNGTSSNTCTNVTFFAESGSVTWNGAVGNTFTAPTSGPYANLLIYMPYGNTSPLGINGNSGNHLTGSIIAVSSNVTIYGNSGTTGLETAIIGYTISLAGNSNTTINYNPAQQYGQGEPTVIQLTK